MNRVSSITDDWVSIPFWRSPIILPTAYIPALDPIDPPVQWLLEALSFGVKLPNRDNPTPM